MSPHKMTKTEYSLTHEVNISGFAQAVIDLSQGDTEKACAYTHTYGGTGQ
jgi:hypothetical protein